LRPELRGVLESILEAIQFISEDTAGLTFDTFVHDRRMRQLVEHKLVVIGEAANRLRRRHPTVAARIADMHQIVGLRNTVIHGYDLVDYNRVWNIVQENLPILQQEVRQLLRKESSP
jgi:uncharacterized protein with HEPN domain